jgi:hypothetical protein
MITSFGVLHYSYCAVLLTNIQYKTKKMRSCYFILLLFFVFILYVFWDVTPRILPQRSRHLLEKLTTVPLPVKQLPALYRTRRFILVFTTARHFSPSSARSIQSTPQSYSLNIHFNIILQSKSRSSCSRFNMGNFMHVSDEHTATTLTL